MSLSSRVIPGESKRSDFPIDLAKTALLVIDIQVYLSSSDNNNNSSNKNNNKSAEQDYFFKTSLPPVLANIALLVSHVRKYRDDAQQRQRSGCEVIFTYLQALTQDCRDVSLDYKLSGPLLGQTLPGPNTPAQFLPTLTPCTTSGKGDILVPKTSCSVFQSTNLEYVLRNLQVEQLIVCGQRTEQCIESAVRDAADAGFFVTVVEDACATASLQAQARGLAGMAGFARILNTATVLMELQQAASAHLGVVVALPMASISPIAESTSKETEATTRPQPDASTSDITKNNNTIVIPSVQDFSWQSTRADMSVALLRFLRHSGIQLLRFATVDINNTLRTKVKPISSSNTNKSSWLQDPIAIARAVVAGMPRHADGPIAASGLTAAHSVVLYPDWNTLRKLPYASQSAMTLGFAHDVSTASTLTLSPYCTRGLLARAMAQAQQEFGLVFDVGAEIEFQLYSSTLSLPVDASTFAQSTTLNQQEDFLADLVNQLQQQQDIVVELIHAESAPGQVEIVLQHQPNPLAMADDIVYAQETIRACAKAHDMKAIFLPKTGMMQAGNGLHLHFSMQDAYTQTNIFPATTSSTGTTESSSSLLSPRAASFLEGVLVHLPGLLALTMPSINSFRRVGPGCWTGHDIRWAVEDKEAPLRICLESLSSLSSSTTQGQIQLQATHAELKLVDSMANPYLAMAGILTAGMHGMREGFILRPESVGDSDSCPKLPGSFSESLDCLEADAYLMQVLGKELSTAYLAVKRVECQHSADMSLDDEVADALRKA